LPADPDWDQVRSHPRHKVKGVPQISVVKINNTFNAILKKTKIYKEQTSDLNQDS
jgi:hypothetical protein